MKPIHLKPGERVAAAMDGGHYEEALFCFSGQSPEVVKLFIPKQNSLISLGISSVKRYSPLQNLLWRAEQQLSVNEFKYMDKVTFQEPQNVPEVGYVLCSYAPKRYIVLFPQKRFIYRAASTEIRSI